MLHDYMQRQHGIVVDPEFHESDEFRTLVETVHDFYGWSSMVELEEPLFFESVHQWFSYHEWHRAEQAPLWITHLEHCIVLAEVKARDYLGAESFLFNHELDIQRLPSPIWYRVADTLISNMYSATTEREKVQIAFFASQHASLWTPWAQHHREKILPWIEAIDQTNRGAHGRAILMGRNAYMVHDRLCQAWSVDRPRWAFEYMERALMERVSTVQHHKASESYTLDVMPSLMREHTHFPSEYALLCVVSLVILSVKEKLVQNDTFRYLDAVCDQQHDALAQGSLAWWCVYSLAQIQEPSKWSSLGASLKQWLDLHHKAAYEQARTFCHLLESIDGQCNAAAFGQDIYHVFDYACTAYRYETLSALATEISEPALDLSL